MDGKTIELLKEFYEKFLENLKSANWNTLKCRYRNFLKGIPLSRYREELQKIKTVEFNLSGKFHSFHLSLINHLYWKEKFVVLLDNNVPERYRKIKNICNYLTQNKGKVPLYKILGKFNFNTEEQFIKWLYLRKYSKGISPKDFITIEQRVLPTNIQFPSFEDFWLEYKRNIDLDTFINHHENYINIDLIKSQLIDEIRNNNPTIFNFLQETDIETKKTEELIKGYILVGLKARMYRTWVSLLTQLDLGYIWNCIIYDKLDSDATLDVKGIDLYGRICDSFIGLQIKKRSKRHEALKIVESKAPIRTVYVAYDLNFEDDTYLRDKLTKLENGFVVFNSNYVNHIYQQITG